MAQVLVTGGTGFIACHCMLRLLADGHSVRTTVRSLARESDVRAMLKAGGAEPGDKLTFATADLMKDDGWAAAAAGCEYVLHVASPLPIGIPKDENDLIGPARAGTLRALKAARDAGAKRVVLTSSFAAIGYGHTPPGRPFTESDWTNPEAAGVSAYSKSKTLAEKAAWDFMAKEGGGLELAVVNPVVVLGPVLGPDYSTSIEMMKTLIRGAVPGCPRLWFGVVDVRDVADMHVRAMTHPAARGERFLCVAGDFLSVRDMALILKERLGEAARRVPTRVLPDWLVRVGSLINPKGRAYLPELGKRKNASAAKAQSLLGWQPRPIPETMASTYESLKRFGQI
ncbi:MAG: aldehyde reductase [Fibrobacteres bacterium]|nr:aldehyde reductase [Fibrobacterota bacterium]